MTRKFRVYVIFLLFWLLFLVAGRAGAAGWQGIDEAVVEKIAADHGRPAKPPVVDTDRGDLLLFLFLAAGAAAGFAAGYYWRMLVEKNKNGKS